MFIGGDADPALGHSAAIYDQLETCLPGFA